MSLVCCFRNQLALTKYAEQALIIREQIEDRNAAKVRAQITDWRGQINP